MAPLPGPILAIPVSHPNPLQPFAEAPLPAVTAATRLARASEAAFQRLGEETVIVLPLTRTLHVLNPTGRFLWEALEGGGRTVADLAGLLAEAYEVEAAKALKDVLAWAAELKRQRVLVDAAEAAPGR